MLIKSPHARNFEELATPGGACKHVRYPLESRGRPAWPPYRFIPLSHCPFVYLAELSMLTRELACRKRPDG